MSSIDSAEIERLRQVASTLRVASADATLPDDITEDALLGEVLVRAGLLSRDTLDGAFELQKDILNRGVPLGLAEVLARRGLVSWPTIDAALAALGITTVECSSCRRSYSIRSWRAEDRIECPVCGSSLMLSRPSETPSSVANGRLASDLPEPDSPLEALEFGRYRVIEELGQGGMGRVSRAWDTLRKRMVALKQVRDDLARDPELIARFLREARLTSRLRHPHIVAVLEVGEHEGRYYYTCDYLPGLSLDVIMRNPVPLDRATRWVYQVADALAHAHEQGVLHRDIKPANILVDQKGWAHVMDFGIAKGFGAASAQESATLTISHQLLGSPPYMSPEQASMHGKEAGPSSDQFSLGVVLYELLTGVRPFQGNSLVALLDAILRHDPIRPSRRNPEVNLDIEAVCLKALEKDPAARYPTMRDVADDLGRFLLKEPVSVCPTAFLERLRAAPRARETMHARPGDPSVIVHLRDVHATLGGTPVFAGLDLKIVEGETFVIVGRSGAGKTLLLRLIYGEARPDRGRVLVDGAEISALSRTEMALFRRHVGLISTVDTLDPFRTVADNLAEVLKDEGTWCPSKGPDAIRSQLATVDLHHLEERLVSTLSPGQRKRLALAAAYLRRPRILLYDDPTGGLDTISAGQINETIMGMKGVIPNLTSIVVSHDLPSAFTVADRMAMLDEGRIVKIGGSNDFLVTEDEQVRRFVLGPYKEEYKEETTKKTKEITSEDVLGPAYDAYLRRIRADEGKEGPRP